jgi:hypothetical protein
VRAPGRGGHTGADSFVAALFAFSAFVNPSLVEICRPLNFGRLGRSAVSLAAWFDLIPF